VAFGGLHAFGAAPWAGGPELPPAVGPLVEQDATAARVGPRVGGDLGEQLVEVIGELPELSVTTTVVSACCLVPLLLLRWRAPRLPGALLVVVLAIVASWVLQLADHGVAVVGAIPSCLPSLAIPSVQLDDALSLLPGALGIFLVTFSDEILTARSFAGRHGQHVRADQELAAMGIADLAAGFTQAFPIGASGSRTAVNDQMGSRTQLSGLLGAGAIALVLLFLTEPMQYLPKATLGAVIVFAAIGLVDIPAWRGLARASRVEVAIAATTMAGVVLIGVLQALIVAVALSILDVVRRSATPHDAVLGWVERLGRYANVRLHPSARVTPGVLVYRLDDRLFFANAGYVRGRIREAIAGAPTPVRWLVFDAEALSHVDGTGIHALTRLNESLRSQDIVLVLARSRAQPTRSSRRRGSSRRSARTTSTPPCGPPYRRANRSERGKARGLDSRPLRLVKLRAPNEAAPEGSTSGDEQS
jgi:sulfate permease, SulP family